MSDGGEKTCPLCAEEMDLTDQQLKACKCGYEICVWCWHHIMDMAEKDDTEGRCPACRTPYDKEKIVGMAEKCERLVAEINSDRRQKSQKAKPKTHEGRNHLSSVRVIQRNLVYIIGLPLDLADEDLLQRKEYFGQYGRVLKVSISRTASGAIQHSSNNSCSVYITYSKEEEAVRCIQSVHGFVLEGRSLRACFGTTKYCHAWLRNMPCSNPDCLYLHDIGTQEDSFTKDEIISAYTRSRVQQITGAINNLQRHSGNVLPPPADEYFNSSTDSTGKPMTKSIPNQNPTSQVRGSPTDGSTVRSIALPAAASWATRVTNSQSSAAVSVACLNGPTRQNPDLFNGSVVLLSAVASTTQASKLHSDAGKKFTITEESHAVNPNGRLGSLQSSTKHDIGRDCRSTVLEKPTEVVLDAVPATVTSNNHLHCLPASKDTDRAITKACNIKKTVDFSGKSCSSCSDIDVIVAADGEIQNLCSGFSSINIDNHLEDKHPDTVRRNSSVSNHLSLTSPENKGLQQYYGEQFRENSSVPASRKAATTSNGLRVPREQSDWRPDSQTQLLQDAYCEAEEDFLAFDDQRLKDLEVASHISHLPQSSHPFQMSNHSSGHSWQHSETSNAINLIADPRIVHTKASEDSILFASSNSVSSNGHTENKVSSTAVLDKIFERSNLFSNVGKEKYLGRLDDNVSNVDKNAALDMGESSIISNILSMDFDTWDDSLQSPHNLAKLLSETDKQHAPLKISSSWKVQNNNQSRFSFARQEDFANHVTDLEPSFSSIGHAPKKNSLPLDSVENREPYFDKCPNGFSPYSFEESDTSTGSHAVVSSIKLSVSRAQTLPPPGFSIPSRVPPPGFSSHERMDLAFDATSGNHFLETSLLRNQHQVMPNGNIGSIGDAELVDPAILAVGKGRLPNGLNNSVLDMRSSFPSQVGSSETEARLQLLMQQSISAQQNLRFSDHIGDRFSPLSDAYGIPLRLEQSQVSDFSPFSQLSLQQSRNARISTGHWGSWNEIHSGNDLGMAELLRNERLGSNNYFPGYEDLKFRMPSSGDLYNRAFGM